MSSSDDSQRVVPVYAVTHGRTKSVGPDVPWESLLTTTNAGMTAVSKLRFEHAQIVKLCQQPTSVAEIGAQLHVPLGVARVLVSDLSSDGFLAVHRPDVNDSGRPPTEVLERLLAGLRAKQ
jgi:hypothetical protein